MRKIIQTIKLRKLKTEFNKEIIETQNENEFLVWFKDGTCKENIRHAVNNNLIKPVKGKNHYLAKKVGKFDENNNLINIYETITEAGKQNKILKTSIVNCLKGKSKTSGGYIWKYL